MLTVTDIPLNRLVPCPVNVRRTGAHARVEELASSIQAHGLLQNLTVRPAPAKRKSAKGERFEVVAGGRRLAALTLLAKREMIAADAPVRCQVLDRENAIEVSLAENALQCPIHPADQFEAFFTLHNDNGMSAEDIAARFGVTAAVVKQRLKLAALSPVLMQAYRDEELNLDQLTAFAITDDHGKQERVWEEIGNDSREAILAALTEEQVAVDDSRAVFVGLDAYQAAGGTILRDLFDEEGEGFLTDADLVYRLATETLEAVAETVRAEGWKWVEARMQQDYAATAEMRRVYAEPRELSDDEQSKLDALEAELEERMAAEDESEDDQAEIERIEKAIDTLQGEDVFDPTLIARAGVIVSIGYDGKPRIERGYIRREDDNRPSSRKAAAPKDGPMPLSASLVAELTAYRTLALRDAVSQKPEIALVAVTHALAARTFFLHDGSVSCLKIRSISASLGTHASGIEDTPTAQAITARHEAWARRMPDGAGDLWAFVASLSDDDRLALLAHCAAMTLDAVQTPHASDAAALAHADQVAEAVHLDMRAHWQPTARSYFGRIRKERILDAVREGVSAAAAENLTKLTKGALAEAAELRMQDSGWLPPLLRAPERVAPTVALSKAA